MRTSTEQVWPILDAAFREFGLPYRLRSDNGPPFASTGAGGLSRLAVKVIKAGVSPERIEPGKPQQNGRLERLHLTLLQDTADPPARTLRQLPGKPARRTRGRQQLQLRRPGARRLNAGGLWRSGRRPARVGRLPRSAARPGGGRGAGQRDRFRFLRQLRSERHGSDDQLGARVRLPGNGVDRGGERRAHRDRSARHGARGRLPHSLKNPCSGHAKRWEEQ